MKKTLLYIFSLLSLSLWAQDGINYQGAATDANGDELTNQNISIRASVLSASASGNLEWEETHSATTDQFGLFNVVIGQGTNTTNGAIALFDDMDWGSGNHFLKIEMDATGGTNYAMIGTTQMMSVPYALYAKNAGSSSGTTSVSTYGDTLYINGQSIIISGISSQNINFSFGSVTDIEGNIYPTVQIGNQEWMTENLKTTTFSNGQPITQHNWSYNGGSLNSSVYDYFDTASYHYDGINTHYNGYAVMDNRNVCPSGWHVPTYQEYMLIFDLFGTFYHNDVDTAIYFDFWTGAYKLKSVHNWGNYPGTNVSNLSFLPTGYYVEYYAYSGTASLDFQNERTRIWMGIFAPPSSAYPYNYLVGFTLQDTLDEVDITIINQRNLSSIRCVKD